MNRRHFLGASAATLAALATGTAHSQTREPSRIAPYAPRPKPGPVVKPGEFVFAVAHLEHSHIYGQCEGLIEAGATPRWLHEPDAARRAAFQRRFPMLKVAGSIDDILDDPEVHLVAAAAIPDQRGALGCRVMESGKDYFTDKTPFTTLAQLEQTRRVVASTGRKYMVYFSERLHTESGMFATDLIQQGAIGRVVQVMGLGPHRLNKASRPTWFFDPVRYGGILCDIGSHQIEQFLSYAGATDAVVNDAAVGNFANPDKPGFEDFGEASLTADNGCSSYFRVDWLSPAGLSTWGDGRTLILGTQGMIELRKYVDLARGTGGEHVYLVDQRGEYHIPVAGRVGFRFFGELILDCLNRSETAMTQAHVFKAAALCLHAQARARRLTGALSVPAP